MLRLAFLAALAITVGMTPADTTASLLTWPDLTARLRPKPDQTISYGTSALQVVDVWLPHGPGPFPTVLMVHGGCWTTRIADRSLMDWVSDDLRRHGIAVWNIEYRGVDRPGGGYPGTFRDVALAADALRAQAQRFHLDVGRVVAIGHSAGGHLALWLAARSRLPVGSPLYMPNPLPIAHVVSLGGLPDLEANAASPDNGCGTAVIAQLVGAPSSARRDVYADTSVARLLPIGVPQDLINGYEDTIIPMHLATGYQEKARKAGDIVALHIAPATGHVELVAPETTAWTEARRLAVAALKTKR